MLPSLPGVGLPPPFPGLEVRTVHNDLELLSARRLHAACYVAADYVSLDRVSVEGVIDDPWVPYSDYLIAIDTDTDEIVGTARMVRPSVRGFPIAQHGTMFPEAQRIFAKVDPNLCTEISALATGRRGLQNAVISAALYRKFGEIAIGERRAYLFAILDRRLLRFMRRTLVLPFEPIGPSKPERSHQTTPMAAYLPRALSHYLQEEPDILEMFAGGRPFSEIGKLAIDLREKAPEDIPVAGGQLPERHLINQLSG